MRRFLSFVMSLCLLTSLSVSAFAVNTTDVVFQSDVMAPDVLNIVVPAEIPIHMSASGEIQVSNTLAIENKSSKAVEIQDIQVDGKNGWAVLDWESDFSDKPIGTKDLALSFRGDKTGSDGQVVLTAGNWSIEKDVSLPINADAKLPLQTESEKSGIATVYWTVDFADSDDSGSTEPQPPDTGFAVPVMPSEYGCADSDSVNADSDGKVSLFPGVIPEPGYLFDKWVNQDNIPVDETTVFVEGDSIKPVFKFDPNYKPDLTVTVPVLPGEHGQVNSDSVQTDIDGKIPVFPVVTPDEGYLFDKWVNQDDVQVDGDTVFANGDSIKPVFKPDPDYTPDLTVIVAVNRGEHGGSNVSEITTNSEGKILIYPDVIADAGWLFDHWENQDNTSVDENTVFQNGDSITPVFNKISDVVVSFEASQYNGSISGNTGPVTVPAGTTWGEITKPTTTAGAQAAFMGWHVGSVELSNDFVISEDLTATANFMSWFDIEGDAVVGFTQAYVKSGCPTTVRFPAVINGVEMRTINDIRCVDNMFRENNIRSIYVEDGYTEFADFSFCNEYYVESFRFPATLTRIGHSALYKCGENVAGKLGSLTVPSGVTSIGASAFCYSGWTSITTPSGCMLSNTNTFSEMTRLTSLIIGNGPSSFNWTFNGCPALTSLTLPASTRDLGSTTFQNLPVLSRLYIYAPKSSVSGSGNPDYYWNLTNSGYAPNVTVYWKAG